MIFRSLLFYCRGAAELNCSYWAIQLPPIPHAYLFYGETDAYEAVFKSEEDKVCSLKENIE
jgi:hypothetical protein